jgi:hypothetical protein
MVKQDASNKNPIFFASAPGFDPSSKKINMARTAKVTQLEAPRASS